MKTIAFALSFAIILIVSAIGCETADLIQNWYSINDPPVILGRPVMQFSWAEPNGIFRIHYDLTGDRAVFNADEDNDPNDGIPDYVNRTGEYLNQAFDTLVTSLQFDRPPFDDEFGGDSLYDVYLTQVVGLTTPEDPSSQYPNRPAFTSYIQLGHDLRTIRYPDDPLPMLKVLSAHELFHAIQFAYRAFSSDLTPWWYESCARWAEEQVFDDINEAYFDVPFYLENAHRSLYRTNGHYIYGSWLFPQYLDQVYGAQFIKECWEHFSVYDFSMLAIRYAFQNNEIDPDYAFCQQAVWNYFTGQNFQPGFYEEGADFPSSVIEARIHNSYPVNWIGEPIPLENAASTYIKFLTDTRGKGRLTIDYRNDTEDEQWVSIIVVSLSNGIDYTFNEIQSGVQLRFIVNDLTSADKVIMIPSWVYEGFPRSHQTSYRYQAHFDTSVVSVMADVSPVPNFAPNAVYPNPFNNSVAISFTMPNSATCTIRIFDINGRQLCVDDFIASSGLNYFDWTAGDDMASGVLFYTIDFNSKRISGKMSLLK